jgi:hypothetical protein
MPCNLAKGSQHFGGTSIIRPKSKAKQETSGQQAELDLAYQRGFNELHSVISQKTDLIN